MSYGILFFMVSCCHTRSTMEHYWKYFQLLYAGCNEADLIDQGETLNTASCADRGVVNSSSISGGVVCYNGAIAGSRADYICNDGFVLVGNKATRVCQSDGNWNGSIPQCSPDKAGMYVCSSLSSAQRYIYMLIGSNLARLYRVSDWYSDTHTRINKPSGQSVLPWKRRLSPLNLTTENWSSSVNSRLRQMRFNVGVRNIW